MAQIGLLFAGQGTQHTGMGKDLYQNNRAAKQVLDAAQSAMPEILGICWEAEPEILARTEHTQPCLFAVDVACYAALADAGVRAAAGAGFSLGEYAALCAAEVFSFEDTFALVRRRSQWMQQAAADHPGGMLAVLGADVSVVRNLLLDTPDAAGTYIANCNAPGQTVVAGLESALAAVASACKANRLRCQRLAVGGPFHTPYMRAAANRLSLALADMHPRPPAFTLYANATGEPYTPLNFAATLARQTMSTVLWEKVIHNMAAQGIDTFIEVGPGKTLSGLLRRIDKTLKVHNVSDSATLQATLCALA